MQPQLFLDMARALERACFDYILLEDSTAVSESLHGSSEVFLRRGIAVPRQDKAIVAALMTQVTSRVESSPRLVPTPTIHICLLVGSRRSTKCQEVALDGMSSLAVPIWQV